MGEVLCYAFCQGDQTIRRGKIVLFLKFGMPSRLNQVLLLRQESSLYPIAGITNFERDELVRFHDDSGFNVSFVNENG